jgi:hypothetical protein
VSERVIRQLRHDPPERIGALTKDTDGQWHLNYFTEMVRQAISPPPDERAAVWKRSHLELIAREFAALGEAGDGRAAKWEWFKERFELATSEFPAYFS